MTKNTPNKRKSLATATATPNKIQKPNASPKKSPKSAVKNQNTPQKKQFNGKQGTPKGKKKPVQTEEDEELEQNESEESMEQELNGNSDSDDVEQADSDEEAESDDDAEEGGSDDDDDESGEEEDTPKEKKPAKTQDISEERKFSAFIGGLNFDCTDKELTEYFNNDGILKVTILRNPVTKKSKGSAFINFTNESSLKKALQKDGTTLQGRTIKVSLPVPGDNSLQKKQQLLKKLKAQVGILEKQIASLSGNKQNKPGNKNQGRVNKKNAGKKPQKA